MRILGAFTNSLGGKDAFTLASSLADIFHCPLDIVTVLPGGEDRAILDTTDIAFGEVVVRQADQWMSEVINDSPAHTIAIKHLRYADSYPSGLLAAAQDLGSTMLVMGGGRHGALGKVSLGSVGNTLLHSSTIPIALAPRGFRHHAYQRLSRITAMLGNRVDPHEHIIDVAVDYASRGESSLRLVSLLESRDPGAAIAKKQLAQTGAETAIRLAGPVSTIAQHGDNTEDAMAALEWKRHEVALVGSSRMAQQGHLFLGSTANKILRATPVPLIVIPQQDSAGRMSQ